MSRSTLYQHARVGQYEGHVAIATAAVASQYAQVRDLADNTCKVDTCNWGSIDVGMRCTLATARWRLLGPLRVEDGYDRHRASKNSNHATYDVPSYSAMGCPSQLLQAVDSSHVIRAHHNDLEQHWKRFTPIILWNLSDVEDEFISCCANVNSKAESCGGTDSAW